MARSFRVTSYNVLADAYATTRLYPSIAPPVLNWERRGPAIVARIVDLRPDIACLQEVQARDWPGLEAAFANQGWRGVYAQKGQARPDGCAVLYRTESIQLRDIHALHFSDGRRGEADSGHLALIGTFETPSDLIRVATTHFRWQAPAINGDDHVGYRQALQLLNHLSTAAPIGTHTIVCGDFNVSPDSPLIELFERSGFVDAYRASPQPTCNPNGRSSRIDYIFATAELRPVGETITALQADTALPSMSEPSDHLPITAALTPQGG
jgi:mRNA deadenylase 3'-5' endonuclease subunit Ccr4